MSLTFFPSRFKAIYARALIGFLLAVLILCAACGGRSAPGAEARDGANSNTGRGEGVAEGAPVSVTTTKAIAREVPSYLQASGSLIADESSDVATQISGQVVSTPVGVGAFVRKGVVIARLNDRDARLRLRQAQASVQQAVAAVRQAEARLGLRPGGKFDSSTIPEVRAAAADHDQALAELRLAEANERRYRELVETGDVSVSAYEQFRSQRDTARARAASARQRLESAINTARQSNQAIQIAEAGVESARSQVAIAQKAVADSVIRAPYAGFISDRPIAVGEYVTPASIVATLLRTNPLKLQLQVPEAEVPYITPGMGVSLEVEAHGDKKFAGVVTAVNPAIDPVSRAATVEAAIENGDNALRSGMFATARIARQGGNKAVFVPRSAVLSDQNTQSFRVFVIQDGVAKLRVVQIGQEEGDMIQIHSGVAADELLATSNLEQLFEGATVKE